VIGEAGTVLTSGQVPWIVVPHRMDLVLSAEPPPERDLVTAAFVLVFDAAQRLLLTEVDLPGRSWDVPGGHIDAAEEAAIAATRELAEETGFEANPAELLLAGWQRFTLFERPDAAYQYPYPLSYLLLFMVRYPAMGPAVHPAPGTECTAAQWCDSALSDSLCAGLSWYPIVAPARGALFGGA
jgi:8-oxo-dGTP pyrophosphatase MutT (NUDIX family)